MGWQIVRHSFVLLWNNLGNALKISVGPYATAIAAILALFTAAGVPLGAMRAGGNPAAMAPMLQQMGGSAVLAILLAWVIILFVSAWVAVSWHRFVLVEEYPALLPGLSGKPILAYVGRTLLLVLVLILVSIPLSFLFGAIGGGLIVAGGAGGGIPALAIGLVFVGILSWLWMRLALVLPATAVGKEMGMGDSWRQTAPVSGAIFLSVLILFGLLFGAGVIVSLVVGNNLIGTALDLILNWISVMVGISILTTLYGHLVEKRDLS